MRCVDCYFSYNYSEWGLNFNASENAQKHYENITKLDLTQNKYLVMNMTFATSLMLHLGELCEDFK